ncbi:hypothetical protein BC828DRAFT_402798 [Blastocladiella britannica]|nr:hypothetical protein BC828DRAFT_402798 [Blastocladiella britannica]
MDSTAAISIALSILSAVCAVVGLQITLYRVVPTPYPYLRRVWHLLRGDPRASEPIPRSTGLGKVFYQRYRTICLTTAAVMQIIGAVSFIVFQCNFDSVPNWIGYQILRIVTQSQAGMIYSLAMTLRVVVIVQNKSHFFRKGYLTSVVVLAVTCIVMSAITISARLVQLTSDNATIGQWKEAYFIPLWCSYVFALMPLCCITGSLWSLQIAFNLRGKGVTNTSQSVSSNNVTNPSSGGAAVGGGSSLIVGAAATARNNQLSSGADNKPTSARAATTTTTGAGVLKGQSIQYSLTRSFFILTFCNVVLWVLLLAIVGAPILPGETGVAAADLIISLAILDEACFSMLLKISYKAGLKSQSGLLPAAANNPSLGAVAPNSAINNKSTDALRPSSGL